MFDVQSAIICEIQILNNLEEGSAAAIVFVYKISLGPHQNQISEQEDEDYCSPMSMEPRLSMIMCKGRHCTA